MAMKCHEEPSEQETASWLLFKMPSETGSEGIFIYLRLKLCFLLAQCNEHP